MKLAILIQAIINISIPFVDILLYIAFVKLEIPPSISATYYTNIGTFVFSLITASNVLYFIYPSKEKAEKIFHLMLGILGTLVIMFPTGGANISGNVGLFNIDVKYSNIVHVSSAFTYFIIMFIIILYFNLPKYKNGNYDKFYIVIGIIYGSTLILFLIGLLANFKEYFAWTFFIEVLLFVEIGIFHFHKLRRLTDE
ncbi:MAG: hypothetical protein LBV51_00130 [Acholeplasmatales bacterium]|jgi:hypothetical protein|nr:hypothetical protein [Acholeplasmatales bacterium]